jgi:hypothetical protein
MSDIDKNSKNENSNNNNIENNIEEENKIEDSENINNEEEEELEERENEKENENENENNMEDQNSENKINSNQNYQNQNINDLEETRDSIGRYISRPHFEIGEHTFLSVGKFMEINPHFNLLQRRISDIRDNIYNNTKNTLLLKSAIQNSKNYLRENSNRVVQNIIEKIWIVKKMCENESKKIQQLHKKAVNQFSTVVKANKEIQDELNECEYMLSHCENEIGYKLLSNPCYSFLKLKNKNSGNFDENNYKTSF